MKGRYLKKFETIQKEVEFIKTHKMGDEVTERALLYSVEVCVEAAMDIVAMRVKDVGMVVEDDYANVEKLVREKIITPGEGELLRKFNGMRNIIVHKYNKLNLSLVKAALGRIDSFLSVVIKIAG